VAEDASGEVEGFGEGAGLFGAEVEVASPARGVGAGFGEDGAAEAVVGPGGEGGFGVGGGVEGVERGPGCVTKTLPLPIPAPP